ncbi:small-conductance mechanosensitive channel [Planktotalea frisia]|jgi:small conductance mechanosensitive channel|uniref:Small-conductance mechanosensitive channel n=1 Tax=Planktotalea frisia TaxID=696762 RepID=A0A1L9NVA6_9RHOB|nr:mechanosensitive ion channel family protein [Planktotalea frisia]MDB9707919.1 mechanosensitive ion channel [Planktotalea frisia]OJI93207.1 small-conductance mechanosensitive channel [Planktotalea frisia]PZX27077.1 small-conductance mechanosensitive channel [Planktotalea frisia]
MRILLVLFMLAMPAMLVAQSESQPDGAIAVEDSATQDAAIAVRIRDILSELDGYEDVTVTVTSGIVTMRGTTLDSEKIARLNDLTGRVEGVVAIENSVTETTDVVKRLNPAVERFRARIAQVIAFIPLASVALLAFIIIVFVGFFIARMRQPWNRLAPNAFIADIYRQILRLGFMVGGLVVALDIMGATALLSTILGAAGIIGLAIGFAVKDTVENFIASIMLSIRQPFRPNDTIEIGGDTGKVIRLTSRATILLSFDGNHIRIPNATVFKSRIVNFSRNDERRFKFSLGLAPETDFVDAQRIALEKLQELPFVLEAPAPAVWIDEIGDSTISITCAGWIEQHKSSLVAARGESIRLVKLALEKADVQMPEPTYRVLSPSLAKLASSDESSSAGMYKELARDADIREESQVAMDVDAVTDAALEQIVDAERKETESGDLLRREAPEE